MSIVKRIIRDAKERVQVDELLAKEFVEAGYGGITLAKTPLGAQINLYTMRPGRVIGKRGRSIKDASEKLEKQIHLVNPQITVIEMEAPELNPYIMASRVASSLERGVHFRRSIFWSLRRVMDNGALGCEIILKGPIRSARARYEKVSEGYIPKAGDSSKKWLRHATIHVKQKRGMLGVTVNIIPPEAKFPDKIELKDLPEIQEPEPVFEDDIPEIEAEPLEENVEAQAPEPAADQVDEPKAEAKAPEVKAEEPKVAEEKDDKTPEAI